MTTEVYLCRLIEKEARVEDFDSTTTTSGPKRNNLFRFIMPGATTQANPSKLDLKLIDETYGTNADLYEDVLRVSTTATQDEIQLAYFDRRSELFTLLAKIDAAARGPRTESAAVLASADQKRYMAERKMDSVVFAVRILADPALRKAYNGLRSERVSASASVSASIASESSRTSGFPEQKQAMPRVVTPTELPPVERTSSSQSESRNWIQSAFSASLFGNSHSKTEDEGEGLHHEMDGDRNRRKSKRRFKQQQQPPSPNFDREEEHEKKSIWGRKKRKKKKQNKEERGINLNDSLDTNATDTSMTDYEDTNHRNKSKTRNNRLTTNEVSPQEAVLRGERSDVDTFDDDDTRQDDDTRTYFGEDGETFATLESTTYSNDDLQEKSNCGNNGMFGCLSGSKAFRRIANEMSDACEDTLISVDQVFNAFTLTDKDIKAVKKKIEKAKKQLDS